MPRRRPLAAPDVITPGDLIDAPQLATLAVLENAIHFARIALLAVHVELLADEDAPLDGRSPDRATRLAERFLVRAHEMHVVILEYRLVVAELFTEERRRCNGNDL